MQSQSVGEKVKYFRQRAGVSQFKLEVLIKASLGSISRLESGRVNPTKETLLAIGDALKLTKLEVAYLFGIVGNEEIDLILNDKSL